MRRLGVRQRTSIADVVEIVPALPHADSFVRPLRQGRKVDRRPMEQVELLPPRIDVRSRWRCDHRQGVDLAAGKPDPGAQIATTRLFAICAFRAGGVLNYFFEQGKKMAKQNEPQQSMEHLGDEAAVSNYQHDLIHELSRTLDAVWRYDQYIANAQGHPDAQKLWRKIKRQAKGNADQLEKLLGKELSKK